MKKFLVIALAVVMMMSTLAISAFAEGEINSTADPKDIQEDTNINVNVEINETTVYYVDVEWDATAFTYVVTKTWKPEEHSYATTGAWKEGKDTATVTVTNHSNADVIAVIAAATTSNGFTAAVTEDSGTANDNKLALASAVGQDVGANVTKATASIKITAPNAEGLTGESTATFAVNITLEGVTA